MMTIPIWLFCTVLFCTASVSATIGFITYSIFKVGGNSDGK